MRKRKIKTIKKKPTEEEAEKLVDFLFPPFTDKYNRMKPQRIGRQKVISISELAKADKEGKEHPLVIEDPEALKVLKALKGIHSPEEESPYTADFTRLKFWEGVLGRLNDEERRFLEYDILKQLKQRQVARKEGISQQRVSQKYQKLWRKLAFVPHLTPLFLKARRRGRLGKLLGKLIEKQYGRDSRG